MERSRKLKVSHEGLEELLGWAAARWVEVSDAIRTLEREEEAAQEAGNLADITRPGSPLQTPNPYAEVFGVARALDRVIPIAPDQTWLDVIQDRADEIRGNMQREAIELT